MKQQQHREQAPQPQAEPEGEEVVSFTVSMPKSVAERLDVERKKDRRTRSNAVLVAVEAYLENRPQRNAG